MIEERREQRAERDDDGRVLAVVEATPKVSARKIMARMTPRAAPRNRSLGRDTRISRRATKPMVTVLTPNRIAMSKSTGAKVSAALGHQPRRTRWTDLARSSQPAKSLASSARPLDRQPAVETGA